MTIRLYRDEDTFRHALVEALRKRGIDVLIPLDVEMTQKTDDEQLVFAAKDERVRYTFNMGDFSRLHSEWISAGKQHAGIILARQQRYSVGEQMRRLLKLIGARSVDEMRNRLEFLSDWGHQS